MSQRARIGGIGILAAVVLFTAMVVTDSRDAGGDPLDAGTYRPQADSVVSAAGETTPPAPEYSTEIEHVSRTDVLTPDETSNAKVIELGAPGSSVLYITTPSEHSRVGFLRQEYPFTLATIKIPNGRYALGYQFEAQYSGALRGLECEIVEATSLLSVGPQEPSHVSVTRGWESYNVNSRLDLPEMTIALSCRANQTGLSDSRFRGVSMFALRLR